MGKKDKITIRKASLGQGMSLKVDYDINKGDGSYSSITEDSAAPVHEDLQAAFKKLHVHLGLISEIIDQDDIMNIEEPKHEKLDDFRVTAFEILESESGVKLTGKLKLSTGKKLSLATPPVKWAETKHPYPFTEELSLIVETCVGEVLAYLGGKHAPKAQLDLEFEEAEGPEVVETAL